LFPILTLGINIVKNIKEESQHEPNGESDENNGAQHSDNAIYLMTNTEGRPNGEAFIEVETENDLEMAIKRNNALMGHRYIEGNYISLLYTSSVSFFKSII
jgi:RNA recognition motif-containing protein